MRCSTRPRGRRQAAVCERALGSARGDRSLPAGRAPFLACDLLGGWRPEREGAIFNEVEANLTAVASQMGMSDVFRLRGVDIHRVLGCVAFGETAAPVQEPGAERDAL